MSRADARIRIAAEAVLCRSVGDALLDLDRASEAVCEIEDDLTALSARLLGAQERRCRAQQAVEELEAELARWRRAHPPLPRIAAMRAAHHFTAARRGEYL